MGREVRRVEVSQREGCWLLQVGNCERMGERCLGTGFPGGTDSALLGAGRSRRGYTRGLRGRPGEL